MSELIRVAQVVGRMMGGGVEATVMNRGDKIGYVVGDASNAYGKVVSETWKKRAAELNIELSPESASPLLV